MRYRPLGRTGQTISAVTLALGERPEAEPARTRLIYAALESGMNAFQLREPGAAGVLGRALQALERRMAVVMLRLSGPHRLDRDAVVSAIEQPLLAGRFGRFEAVVVDAPARLTEDGWAALEAALDAGRVRAVGVSGEGVSTAIARPLVEVFGCAYHLGSEWADRNRIRTAVEAGCSVIGEGYHPRFDDKGAAASAAPPRRGLFGLGRKPSAIERVDGYEFLARTPGWRADEICLAFALTEPSLATVVIEATTPEDVERLAAVCEREMPTGLAAQVEMARFSRAA